MPDHILLRITRRPDEISAMFWFSLVYGLIFSLGLMDVDWRDICVRWSEGGMVFELEMGLRIVSIKTLLVYVIFLLKFSKYEISVF